MKRTIKKVAVLGSGVMGSRIACHFANAGVSVLLLDIAPSEPDESELRKGLSAGHSEVKNRIVNNALDAALKSSPSPVFHSSVSRLIETGNFTDDFHRIAQADWVIEVVVENITIKQTVFERVEQYRKPGSLITSNTSGIPIQQMAEGRSDDFKKHFCGTHFFNPPRYLKLLEIIPSSYTNPEVISFLMHYGDLFLGKTTVLCKDTPAFIANRIGVFGILSVFHFLKDMELSIEDIDKLTGPIIGRPKSATFRTSDVVGLDTLIHVAKGLQANLPQDEARHMFELPDFINQLNENKWLGDKSGQGFYKKAKSPEGKTEILVLDIPTLSYRSQRKNRFESLDQAKKNDNLSERVRMLFKAKDKAGEFYRKQFNHLFSYVSNRIPEISDELYRIDEAMKAGFGWDFGPFEYWDSIGIGDAIKAMEADGLSPAKWVIEMQEAGHGSFYKIIGGVQYFYDPLKKDYEKVPGYDSFILLDHIRKESTVWKNPGCTLTDMGEGVLNLEFHTKMNAIDSHILQGVQKSIEIAEKDFKGLVIGNEAPNFSAGANLAMIFMMSVEQDWDEIDFSIRAFQNTVMRIRYSSVPVVLAPHGMTLGGACEMCLHADKVVAATETYTGLVEFGVGLIPAGGGTKEFVLRASDDFKEGEILLPGLRDRFLTIGQAKVSTSAEEAYHLGILKRGRDEYVMNSRRQLRRAKEAVIDLADAGYTKPTMRKDIKVLGRTGLGMIYAGANAMFSGRYISEHDKKISEKLGYVMCGGDLSAPALVSEQYLLDLEREAFLSLCGEKKTLERIQSILTTGKVLRN